MCRAVEEQLEEAERISPPVSPDGSRADAIVEPGHPGVRRPRVPGPLQELWLLPRNAAIACMQLYRRLISPLYGQVCRYYPSCSRYALEAFQRQGFVAGTVLTAWRLLRCNPFSRGGVDDAPQRRHPSFSVNTRGFVRPAL